MLTKIILIYCFMELGITEWWVYTWLGIGIFIDFVSVICKAVKLGSEM